MIDQHLSHFSENGVIGPFNSSFPLSPAAIAEKLTHDGRLVPGLLGRPKGEEYWNNLGTRYAWYKSLHFHSDMARRLGTTGAIADTVGALLGTDLLLWGCDLIMKGPGDNHRWHADLECEDHGITVWLALANTCTASGLKLISGSHLYGIPPQQLSLEDGVDLHSDASVLRAARRVQPTAVIGSPLIHPGQYLVFHGGVWHASYNESDLTRTALVLQYSPAGARPRVPRRTVPPMAWHTYEPPVLAFSSRSAFPQETAASELTPLLNGPARADSEQT